MTEGEWPNCRDPHRMLDFLGEMASERKLRLLACACCRRAWDFLDDPRGRRKVEVAELLAEGKEIPEPMREAFLTGRVSGPPYLHETARFSAGATLHTLVHWTTEAATAEDASAWDWWPDLWRAEHSPAYEPALRAEHRALSHLVRDLFGNPFRPSVPEPAWLTPSALAVARAVLQERRLPEGTLEPARLGILADALEDAGCDDVALLGHLRSPGPHYLGCWPVDLVLGKE